MSKLKIQTIIWMWLFIGAFIILPQACTTEEVVVVEKIHYIYVPEELIPEAPVTVVEYTEPIPPKYTFTEDDIYLLTVLLCAVLS